MSNKENSLVSMSERWRREAAVKLGRQEIHHMELERELETAQRKIQQLLGLSQNLERRLGEIEAEKQEQEDPEVEVVRRQTVVKLWRLQVRAMERQRMLERMKKETEELLGLVKEYEQKIQRGEKKIQTEERQLMEIKKKIDKRLLELELQPKTDEERRKLLQDLKEKSEEFNKDFYEKRLPLISNAGCQNLALINSQGDLKLTLTKAKLEEFAVEIQQDKEEAEALR